MEKCGHVAHLEQPAVMRDALFEFKESVSTPAARGGNG